MFSKRCRNCGVKVSRSDNVCPHCGARAPALNADRLLAIPQTYVAEQKSPSIQQNHRARNEGLLAGVFGCVFGLLGILTTGLVFVPLAALCSIIGLLLGLAGRSSSGFLVSLLGTILTIFGFAVSPSLWLVVAGLLVASQRVEPSAPSASTTVVRNVAAHDANGVQPTMTVLQVNQIVSWSAADDGNPKIYSINGMTITLSSRKDHQDEDLSEPVLSVRASNGQEYDLVGQSNFNASARFGVGTLDPAINTNQIIFTSDSGGNHCCTEVKVLELAADGWKELSIGSFSELGKLTHFPTDLDGDGVPDIIAVDDRFLGAFDGFGVVFLPPKVFNVRAGSVLDVSKETRFTKLYRADMEKAQKGCLAHTNGACAAFVADAFRAGLADWAWQIMLRNYDANNGWLPNVCLVAEVNMVCPESKQKKFANFPDALTWFLSDGGYITPVSQAGAQQVLPSSDDLSTRANEFVLELLRMWSEPNDPKLSRLDSLYADQVSYYGKPKTRQAVMDDKVRFATRWPDRKYQLRPGTLVANCEQVSSTCEVDGIVDWQARSHARGATSSGSTRISYTLAAAGPSFIIVSENSSILQRKTEFTQQAAADHAAPANSGNVTQSPPVASSPAPAAQAPAISRTPIEKDAVLYGNSKEDLVLIDKLADFVKTNDFRCNSVSAARPAIFSGGFVLTCNQFRYTYDIQDKGGHWVVTVR